MILPWVRIVWISDNKGYGLVATQPIPKGTITFVQDGLDIVISNTELEQIDSKLLTYVEKYSYEDFNGNRIISWDLGKYMNHEDKANTLSTGYGFEVAICDIEPGDEVTDDYRIFSTHHDTNSWPMGPLSTNLEPWPSALLEYWNTEVSKALKCAPLVDQPLLTFVQEDIWASVLKANKSPKYYRCVSEAFPLRYKLQTSGIAQSFDD